LSAEDTLAGPAAAPVGNSEPHGPASVKSAADARLPRERAQATDRAGEIASTTRAGYVTILGLPNVGKSTLLNRILKEKISITSSKPQTTRRRITGIFTQKDAQAVFVDTPGILKPSYALQRALAEEIQKALDGVDVIWLVRDSAAPESTTADPAGLEPVERAALAAAGATPVFFVLNKMDVRRPEEVARIVERLGHDPRFSDVHAVSATTGEGVEELLSATLRRLPPGGFFFEPDQLTDRSMRFLAAEFVRETLFEELGQELPYATHVEVTAYDESRAVPRIEAVIYVERESQKGMVIGRGGAMLKRIGMTARRKIEGLAGHQVFLQLTVKVRPNWRRKEIELRRFGYGR
jgi:GTP-binding protein Era